jgi:hypothetical protein
MTSPARSSQPVERVAQRRRHPLAELPGTAVRSLHLLGAVRGVAAAQVDPFESKTLKPGFSLHRLKVHGSCQKFAKSLPKTLPRLFAKNFAKTFCQKPCQDFLPKLGP